MFFVLLSLQSYLVDNNNTKETIIIKNIRKRNEYILKTIDYIYKQLTDLSNIQLRHFHLLYMMFFISTTKLKNGTTNSKQKCTVCHKQIMRSPKSAVCVHCNALLGPDWTPYNWSCKNVDGTSAKRFLPPPENKEDDPVSSDTKAKEDLKPCGEHLHSAIAGKLVNVDGRVPEEAYVKGSGDCYGFVMIH